MEWVTRIMRGQVQQSTLSATLNYLLRTPDIRHIVAMVLYDLLVTYKEQYYHHPTASNANHSTVI